MNFASKMANVEFVREQAELPDLSAAVHPVSREGSVMVEKDLNCFPEISAKEIPTIDTAQMIEVDRAMMEDYRIELIQMMENAGRNLAHLARTRFFNGNPVGKQVLVMAGSGGNGGGALVAARRLANWGAQVSLSLGQEPGKMTPVPAHQLDILQRMDVDGSRAPAVMSNVEGKTFDLILDGLIGYSLKGAPYGLIGDLILYANHSVAPVLSLDTPSGIDTTSGTVYDPAIKATATMTLAMPKEGLFSQGVPEHTGDLYLADISVPPKLYSSPALAMNIHPIFATGDIIKII